MQDNYMPPLIESSKKIVALSKYLIDAYYCFLKIKRLIEILKKSTQ
jgi:hypothetical protein